MNGMAPSLNALRTFETAARHGSFSHAAGELCVTPGAVSRQIALLESQLDARLFERNKSGIKLTTDGEVLLKGVRAGLLSIQDAVRRLGERKNGRPLHVACPMTFATFWLLPRLIDLHARAPELQIRLTSGPSLHLPDENESADIFIYLGREGLDQSDAPLLPGRVAVVCSPDLLRSHGPFDRPEDLDRVPLLGSALLPMIWRDWFASAGGSVNSVEQISFPNSAMAYQAALKGAGCVIANSYLVRNELESGQLKLAHPHVTETGWSYFMTSRSGSGRHPGARVFHNWIMEAVDAERAWQNARSRS